MSSANERQVGGAHYRSAYQHWDFVEDVGLGYLEGQITKYICRHAKKNGLQDVEKAGHFLDKLMEERWKASQNGTPVDHANDVERFLQANDLELTSQEAAVIRAVCFYSTLNELKWAQQYLQLIAERYAPIEFVVKELR